MNYIKGFLATLCLILLQIAIVISGVFIGGWLTLKYDSFVWFFITFFITIVIAWAVYGGFFFGAAKTVIRHDR